MKTDLAVPPALSRWLQEFIVGQQICPFAGPAIARDELSIRSVAPYPEDVVQAMAAFAVLPEPRTELLLVEPFLSFEAFDELLQLAEQLAEQGLEGEVVVAGFHPDFVFAEEEKPARASSSLCYLHRAPVPILHLLRAADLDHVPLQRSEQILARNRVLVEQLGANFFRSFRRP